MFIGVTVSKCIAMSRHKITSAFLLVCTSDHDNCPSFIPPRSPLCLPLSTHLDSSLQGTFSVSTKRSAVWSSITSTTNALR
jgi:hypothetical protein